MFQENQIKKINCNKYAAKVKFKKIQLRQRSVSRYKTNDKIWIVSGYLVTSWVISHCNNRNCDMAVAAL